jgi:adenine-specific DNA-methyltransferase
MLTGEAPTVQNTDRKRSGAYYTDETVADFLVRWAVRRREDLVADPSFGGGVFLEAAARRLQQLGGDSKTLYGVELDEGVYHQTRNLLSQRCGLGGQQLLHEDFFAVRHELPLLDAIVGNPPFVRFQTFKSEARRRAWQAAQEQGVQLSKLASSWAAFLVHAVSFLNRGGRMAMVVPAELAHATYAVPVLNFLLESFGSVSLLRFRQPLFPKLSQETFLLLADCKGHAATRFLIDTLPNLHALKWYWPGSKKNMVQAKTLHVAPDRFLNDGRRLDYYFVDSRTRQLYETLCTQPNVQWLGAVAKISLGYVSGANSFFHLSEKAVAEWNLPRHALRPAVFRASAFKGLTFTSDDWMQAEPDAGYLFHPSGSEEVEAYLEHGLALGVAQAYKCRSHSP